MFVFKSSVKPTSASGVKEEAELNSNDPITVVWFTQSELTASLLGG